MPDQPPLIRYVGDDWTFGPITLVANGVPFDLTGATVTGVFFSAYALDPVATLTEGVGITAAADRTAGVLSQITVPRALTADVTPQSRNATTFPTRLAIVVEDSLGLERTWLLVLFLPLDRRSDVPPAAA